MDIWVVFHRLANANSIAVGIYIQVFGVFFFIPVFISFEYVPWSGVVELYGNFMFKGFFYVL